MASNYVQVQPQSTGLKMDTSELTVGANTVERQNICIADPTTAANIATVNASGALNVALASGTNTIGSVNAAEATKASYFAAAAHAGTNLGDVVVITGSATKTIRIREVILSISTVTANTVGTIQLIKRTTADSSGTSTSITAGQMDSADAAPTATIKDYTVAPTTGTSGGVVYSGQHQCPISGGTAVVPTIIRFDALNTKSLVLSGTSQQLAINLATFSTSNSLTLSWSIWWTEE